MSGLISSVARFIQDGIGAIRRTVQDKLRESVSVTDYATPQDALNTGKNVRFPAGLYVVDQPLIGKSKQTIFLEGGATVRAGVAMRAVFMWTDAESVTVRGEGVIDGNNLATSGVLYLSAALNASDLLVTGVTIQNTKHDPTLQYGGVEVSSTDGAGGGKRAKRVTIRNVRLLNTGTHGAITAYADHIKFHDNYVDGASNHGFEAVDCKHVSQIGNEVRNCLISGLGVGTNTLYWFIGHNLVVNCGGDGAITCEHNSNFGGIERNTIIDANGSSGINVSFGTPGAEPVANVQNVRVAGNLVACKAGLLDRYGINFYSSTGSGVGKGVTLIDNTIDGFNVGIAYQYAEGGRVHGNTIRRLVGNNSRAIVAQMVTRTKITENTCDTDTTGHAIEILDYAGITSDRCTIAGNSILASAAGGKALVYIEGNGTHTVADNSTGGSSHYVQCAGAAVVLMARNTGNLASTPYLGGTVTATSNGNGSQDVLLVGGIRITAGVTAPTTGTWNRGDRCFNTEPSDGAAEGWACVVSGTPGTWVNELNGR